MPNYVSWREYWDVNSAVKNVLDAFTTDCAQIGVLDRQSALARAHSRVFVQYIFGDDSRHRRTH